MARGLPCNTSGVRKPRGDGAVFVLAAQVAFDVGRNLGMGVCIVLCQARGKAIVKSHGA